MGFDSKGSNSTPLLAADAVGLKELGWHGVVQCPDQGDGALARIRDLRAAAEELEGGGERAIRAVQPDEQINRITARSVVYEVLAGHTGLRGAALGLPVQVGEVYGVVLVQSGGRKILVAFIQGYKQGVSLPVREMQHPHAALRGGAERVTVSL